MKEAILTSGKKYPVESLTCRQTEALELDLNALKEEKNPFQVTVKLRRLMLRACAQGITNSGKFEVTEETLMDQLTDSDLAELYKRVLGYSEITQGEATATGSTLPTSTVA